jgi:hypothetical protein
MSSISENTSKLQEDKEKEKEREQRKEALERQRYFASLYEEERREVKEILEKQRAEQEKKEAEKERKKLEKEKKEAEKESKETTRKRKITPPAKHTTEETVSSVNINNDTSSRKRKREESVKGIVGSSSDKLPMTLPVFHPVFHPVVRSVARPVVHPVTRPVVSSETLQRLCAHCHASSATTIILNFKDLSHRFLNIASYPAKVLLCLECSSKIIKSDRVYGSCSYCGIQMSDSWIHQHCRFCFHEREMFRICPDWLQKHICNFFNVDQTTPMECWTKATASEFKMCFESPLYSFGKTNVEREMFLEEYQSYENSEDSKDLGKLSKKDIYYLFVKHYDEMINAIDQHFIKKKKSRSEGVTDRVMEAQSIIGCGRFVAHKQLAFYGNLGSLKAVPVSDFNGLKNYINLK